MNKLIIVVLTIVFASPVFAQNWLSNLAKVAVKGDQAAVKRIGDEILRQVPSTTVLNSLSEVESAAVFDGIRQSEFMKGPLSHNVPELVKQLEESIYQDILWHRIYWIEAFKKNPAQFLKDIRFESYSLNDMVFMSDEPGAKTLLPKDSKVFFLQGDGNLWKSNQTAQLMLAQHQMAFENYRNQNMVLAPKAPTTYRYMLPPVKNMNLVKDVKARRWSDKQLLNVESGSGNGAEALYGLRFPVQKLGLQEHVNAAELLTGASRPKRAVAFSHVGSVDISKEATRFIESVIETHSAKFPAASYFVIDYKRPYWNTSILPISLDHPGSVARLISAQYKPFVIKFSDKEGDLVSYIRTQAGVTLPKGEIVVVRARGQAANLLGANLYIWVR